MSETMQAIFDDDSAVIVGLLDELEDNMPNWYWPGGKSGPTIGIGVDVGQFSKKELKDILNNTQLYNKIKGLAGIKGSKAGNLFPQSGSSAGAGMSYSSPSPLLTSLTPDEVEYINKAFINHQYSKIKRHFTKAYPNINFDLLSPPIKASIVGLYYSAPARIEQQRRGIFAGKGKRGGYKDIHNALKKVDGGDMTGWNDFHTELASHDWGYKGSAMDNRTDKISDYLLKSTGGQGTLSTHEKIFGGVDNLFKGMSDINTAVDALPRYQLNLKPGSK